MSEYTPTTEEVRTAAHNGAFFPLFRDPADFDRWLVAHDAEVRASVIPEEPDGEVEYRVFDREGELWAATNSLDEARHYLMQEPSGYARIERAVWLPVEQEEE